METWKATWVLALPAMISTRPLRGRAKEIKGPSKAPPQDEAPDGFKETKGASAGWGFKETPQGEAKANQS